MRRLVDADSMWHHLAQAALHSSSRRIAKRQAGATPSSQPRAQWVSGGDAGRKLLGSTPPLRGLERGPEPRRVSIRRVAKVACQRRDGLPAPVADFRAVRRGVAIESTHIDMKKLALDQIASRVVRLVDERRHLAKSRLKAELLLQPACGRIERGLARARMAAAGVRPESAEVVLRERAPLEQQFVDAVEDQDRERAVEPAAVLMGAEFLLDADLLIELVDENDLFDANLPARLEREWMSGPIQMSDARIRRSILFDAPSSPPVNSDQEIENPG